MTGLTEIERGRSEAAHTVLRAGEVRPYIDPPRDTPLPLRYAFYLLGDIRGKKVLDLGCGSGENVAPLLARGASVVAVDLSHKLVELARKRMAISNQHELASFAVGSAYNVPLPDEALDAILCASLLHHLEITRAMAEMRRLLKPGGIAIVKEPVRFSKLAARVRRLFPAQEDISEDEHPLSRDEMEQVKKGWEVTGERAFRLPFVPLFSRGNVISNVWIVDRWLLDTFSPLEHYSTSRVLRLQKIE